MAAVQKMEEHRSGPSVTHLRELAQRTESRKEDRRALTVRKAREDVGRYYHIESIIGEGGYGVVFSAMHRSTGLRVAVKRVAPFEHHLLAVRTLRELRLLKFFHDNDACENVIRLVDVVIPGDRATYQDVYLVQEMMDTDLYRVLRTQALSFDHSQYFTYQILRGLKPIHSAGVVHRDIKPSNLLVNANCDLKICDFGLARDLTARPPGASDMQLTEYVATRWYRAPEIMLSSRTYTKAVDVWSVGCTLYEMLAGQPLFPGKDYHHQMTLILSVLGTESIESIAHLCAERAIDYVHGLPHFPKKPFRLLLPNAHPDVIDFLERTVCMDPRQRMTVEECLRHPFVAPYHDPHDEPAAPQLDPRVFCFDTKDPASMDAHRLALWDDAQLYRLPACRV
ncbi:mitogen-activated protein kinase [Malassezia caprae]|uniref:Mitogen-activated protein kinase n=1 Tax=Malassezia caprae TaxID=1381934 RepID=A0AAF0EDS7_9BASI|nr:mitogen-activated protein kinase [Malassezia caprae]